ncbi:MAG: hypothetical protein IT370_16395 [Deltaproteobacteria bacterium]|nr:hypothetical protein [Deltaproteobacteria bacterium]
MSPRSRQIRQIRHVLLALLAFLGLNALGGGLYGMAGAQGVPTAPLAGSPFASYFVPSLILFTVVGGALVLAAIALWVDHAQARRVVLAASAVVLGWIAVQLLIVGFISWLQPVVAALGVVVIILAARLPREAPRQTGARPTGARAWFLGLATLAAPLLAIAAGVGVAWPGTYQRDAASIAAQAVGQDWVTLVLAVPLLLVGVVTAWRGSTLGHLLALGVLGYVVYGYLLYAFGVRHNELFLCYVAILGASVWGLVAGLIALAARPQPVASVGLAWRWMGGFFVGIALVFVALWLSQIIPPLVRGETPAAVREWGTPTNGVHVIDLALVLPLLAWAGARLWRRDPAVVPIAGVLLFKIVTLGIAILAMGVAQLARGTTVDLGLMGIFVALTGLALATLVQYVRAVRRSLRPV